MDPLLQPGLRPARRVLARRFGTTRSHGCTDIPPEDARWLFHWTDPDVPDGWHGVHKAGTHVYLTRG